MKRFWLILLLTGATAFAAPPKTSADYAQRIAKNFAQLKTPDAALEMLKIYTSQKEQSELAEYWRNHPLKKLPTLKAIGSALQFNFDGRVLNLQVVDGAKNLFSIGGVEISLSTRRPLAARLRQIDEFIKSESSSAFWQLLLPQADAQTETSMTALPVAAVGAVNQQASEYELAIDAGGNAYNIYFLCHQLVTNPKVVPSNAFSDKTWAAVNLKRFAKKPIPPETSDWEGPAIGYLAKVKSRYCISGMWHNFKKNYVPLEETSGAQDDTCAQIKKTIACLKKLEDKKGSKLYLEQRAEVTRWLTGIEPEGGKAAATELANQTGVRGVSAASK